MKKLSMVLLSAMMFFGLVGCKTSDPKKTEEAYLSDVKATDIKLSDTKNLVEASQYQIQSMDYVTTALAEDHEYNANFVDGLLENDQYGNIVPCLATSYEVSDDGLTYTFHLREGVKWVTNTGEEYATLTADDFVTGLRHGAEFNSGTGWLLEGVIEGYTEYFEGEDYSDEAWAKVGIEAVDDLTVAYHLVKPTPYFRGLGTYAVLYPINRQFLESKGSGCELGSPDKTACEFGTTAADSILYNGGYILQSFDLQSSTVLKKNEAYWDAEHVYLDTVTRIYDDGSDPYSGIRGFEQGRYAAAGISASWENYDQYVAKYEGYITASLPNASVFGVVFNFNRQSFEYTNNKDNAELHENTHKAILNENFRKALRAAYDTKAYNMTYAPEDLSEEMLRNIDNDPQVVKTSDGTSYGKLVNDAYEAMTGEKRDLSDGQNPWLSKEEAMSYIEAAKAEGVEFPVHLDMLVPQTSKKIVDQSLSMKDSVEKNTDGNIVIELVMADQEKVQQIAYYNQDPALSDYDISTFTGWSPDYPDPKSFIDIYSPTMGYFMTSVGLNAVPASEDTPEEKEIKEVVGLNEYEQLYRTADEIYEDLDARYEAFAKADACLVKHAFFLPGMMQSRTNRVSHVIPFTRVYSTTGLSEYKYKGLQLQKGLTTTEEYEAAYQEWLKGGK